MSQVAYVARHAARPVPTTVPNGSESAAESTATPPVRRRLGRLVSWVLLLVGLVSFLGLAVGPHVLGYRTSTMLTGSMAPGIEPGDMVVTVPRNHSELAVGDVISYHIPVEDHRVETHRVVEIDREGVRTTVRTKGDANPNVDPWVAVLDGDTVYEEVLVVPHVGTVIRALRAPVVHDVLLWLAIGGMLVSGLTSIWSRNATGTTGTTAQKKPGVKS